MNQWMNASTFGRHFFRFQIDRWTYCPAELEAETCHSCWQCCREGRLVSPMLSTHWPLFYRCGWICFLDSLIIGVCVAIFFDLTWWLRTPSRCLSLTSSTHSLIVSLHVLSAPQDIRYRSFPWVLRSLHSSLLCFVVLYSDGSLVLFLPVFAMFAYNAWWLGRHLTQVAFDQMSARQSHAVERFILYSPHC